MIVLVSGPPGSGKTTLARQLAPKLGLALIAKDDIKEKMYDTLGWSDREWSQKLGSAVWEILFILIDNAVAHASIMVESNFHTEHRARFNAIRARGPVIEVHCRADPVTLERRIRERPRHPGHAEQEVDIDGIALLGAHQPVVDHVIDVDTEHAEQVDVDGIVRWIQEAGL